MNRLALFVVGVATVLSLNARAQDAIHTRCTATRDDGGSSLSFAMRNASAPSRETRAEIAVLNPAGGSALIYTVIYSNFELMAAALNAGQERAPFPWTGLAELRVERSSGGETFGTLRFGDRLMPHVSMGKFMQYQFHCIRQ